MRALIVFEEGATTGFGENRTVSRRRARGSRKRSVSRCCREKRCRASVHLAKRLLENGSHFDLPTMPSFESCPSLSIARGLMAQTQHGGCVWQSLAYDFLRILKRPLYSGSWSSSQAKWDTTVTVAHRAAAIADSLNTRLLPRPTTERAPRLGTGAPVRLAGCLGEREGVR
jgi:hypothetical protein